MKSLRETFKFLEKFEDVSDNFCLTSYDNNSNEFSIALSKDRVGFCLDMFGENETTINLTFENKVKTVKYSGENPLLPPKEKLEEALNYFINSIDR